MIIGTDENFAAAKAESNFVDKKIRFESRYMHVTARPVKVPL